jgi:hypothetical protein
MAKSDKETVHGVNLDNCYTSSHAYAIHTTSSVSKDVLSNMFDKEFKSICTKTGDDTLVKLYNEDVLKIPV